MTRPFIEASRVKHSPGPYHYNNENPVYETVISTQGAMSDEDTQSDVRLLMASPCMFDLLNRIAGGEESGVIILGAQKLVDKIAG